jgi:hypothetical protein
MKTAKVLRVKTDAAAHIVVRDGSGRKLFEVDLPGVTVVLSVPSDAVINIEPAPVTCAGRHHEKSVDG